MGFINIIPETEPKRLTNDTTFYNYILIVNTYSKISKLCGTERITIEEVMGELDMIQYRFRKIDESGWCDLEIISASSGM